MTCFASKPAWYPNPETQPVKPQQPFLSMPTRPRPPDLYVNCGKCEGCRASQRRDWGIRIYHETQMHPRNSFLTLTYNDENLPADGKIDKEHFRQFIRKLHRYTTAKLRYFGCGEYGERTNRPHYHAIIFGEDFRDNSYDVNDSLYGNAVLDRIWGNGQITIGPAESGSCMYTANYVSKKTGCTDTFALQSRTPPLGKSWVRKHHDNLRRLETVQVQGQELPIPKVYLEWLKGVESFQHIKENRRTNVKILNDRKLYAKRKNLISKANLKGPTL